jgi:uncharacterized protein
MPDQPDAIAAHEPPRPWWRFGMVWLVIGGPAAVVLAALATAVIAFRGADVVVSSPQASSPAPQAEVPAVQARNQGAAVPVRRAVP